MELIDQGSKLNSIWQLHNHQRQYRNNKNLFLFWLCQLCEQGKRRKKIQTKYWNNIVKLIDIKHDDNEQQQQLTRKNRNGKNGIRTTKSTKHHHHHVVYIEWIIMNVYWNLRHIYTQNISHHWKKILFEIYFFSPIKSFTYSIDHHHHWCNPSVHTLSFTSFCV